MCVLPTVNRKDVTTMKIFTHKLHHQLSLAPYPVEEEVEVDLEVPEPVRAFFLYIMLDKGLPLRKACREDNRTQR